MSGGNLISGGNATSGANVKLLAWNIRHGGGRRAAEITLALLEHAPDLVVLTEFRSALGGQIRGVLADHGWTFQHCTEPRPRTNGILVASRTPVEPRPDRFDRATADGRWIDVRLPGYGLDLSGVHVPDDSKPAEKAAYWQYLIRLAAERASSQWLVLGDFNSGRHRLDEQGAKFRMTHLLGRFAAAGMRDAWRSLHPAAREYSWFSHRGRGYRIDSAWASVRLLDRVMSAEFSHQEREQGLSDHSALVVEIARPAVSVGADARTRTTLELGDASAPGESVAPRREVEGAESACAAGLFGGSAQPWATARGDEHAKSMWKSGRSERKSSKLAQKALFVT